MAEMPSARWRVPVGACGDYHFFNGIDSMSSWGFIMASNRLSIELGEYGIRATTISPGSVEGPRIQRVLDGQVKQSGCSIEEEKEPALATQSVKRFVDPRDIAPLAVFLASDVGKSISGQMLSIDNDAHQAS